MELQPDLFLKFFTALALGALVGAEREIRKGKDLVSDIGFAGFRTYSLVSILGFLGAYLGNQITPWILLILLAVVSMFFLAEHFNEARKLNFVGITSEIAALITFLVGVVTFYSSLLAVILTVVMVLILNFKTPLHSFIRNLESREFLSAIKFIIVAFVILPLLPKAPIDPWGWISLSDVWLVVVLVSGIGFVGYILVKTVGTKKGLGLTALLGGIVSSTATTISLAQEVKKNKKISLVPFLFAITVATCVLFGKVFLEVAVINPSLLLDLTVVMGSMLAMSLVVLIFLWKDNQKTKAPELELSSPFRLWPAVQFGLLYLLILILSQVGQRYFGQSGVYLTSFIGGLGDADAIILSLSTLSMHGKMEAGLAIEGITIAVMTNTLVKILYVRIFGTSRLFKWTALTLLPVILTGAAVMYFF